MNLGLDSSDVFALSPLWILLSGSLIILLVESFFKKASDELAFGITLLTLVCSGVGILYAPASLHVRITQWVVFDPFARFFALFFLATGGAAAVLSDLFLKRFQASRGEYYFFLLAAIFGCILTAASADFLTLFLGLETLSLALYVMTGYMKGWSRSGEGAIKYFLLGVLASALLLYGIALLYGSVGTTNMGDLQKGYLHITDEAHRALFLGGIGLITIGLLFKAAAVPFHTWAPDVYDAASSPVTAFMAVGVKTAAFAALARLFLIDLNQFDPHWNDMVALVAYPTLIVGNLFALRQTSLRRFFAYSGISHTGYLLFPFVAGQEAAILSLQFYLGVYGLATLGAFGVLIFLDGRKGWSTINDLKGLFWSDPWPAAILALCLLTLSGLPPMAGFLAKFYLFQSVFYSGHLGLVFTGLLMTVLSAFYYLRLIAFMGEHASPHVREHLKGWQTLFVGGICTAALVLLSFYPELLLNTT